MKRKNWTLVASVAVLLAIATTIWIHRANERRQIVRHALSAQPDFSQTTPALLTRITEATEQAGRRGQEVAGLTELSRLYHANGFLREAASCYEGLQRLQPEEPRWPHREAMILAGYGEIGPGLTLWERVIALAPSYLPARLRLADALLKTNQREKAATIYQSVLEDRPDEPYALFGLARIDWELGRLEQARERLEQVVQQTHFQLGYDLIVSVYEKLGRNDQAQAIRSTAKASGAYRDPADPWIEELFEDCYDPHRLSLAAGFAARNGSFDTATLLLERAIHLGPADVSARFQLGGLYLQRENPKDALAQFSSCTTLAPDFADGWIQLSVACEKLGDEVGARRALLNGLLRCPDSPGLHLARGRQLRKGKQTEAAAEELKASIRLRPNESEAYIELGNLYIETDRTADGVDQLQKSLQAEPENPAALGTLAFHAIITGNEREARQWMGRVNRQPRIPREQVEQLNKAYGRAFGGN